MIRKVFATFFCCSLIVSTAEARRSPKSVKEPIKSELNEVLSLANQLHEALFQENTSDVNHSIGRMLRAIREAEQKLATAQAGVSHLSQVLGNIRGNLSVIETYPEAKRKEPLRTVFSEVVQIARNYRLDKYRLFFCPKDRSVWLQKSWKAKHPFSPNTLRNCGSLIR